MNMNFEPANPMKTIYLANMNNYQIEICDISDKNHDNIRITNMSMGSNTINGWDLITAITDTFNHFFIRILKNPKISTHRSACIIKINNGDKVVLLKGSDDLSLPNYYYLDVNTTRIDSGDYIVITYNQFISILYTISSNYNDIMDYNYYKRSIYVPTCDRIRYITGVNDICMEYSFKEIKNPIQDIESLSNSNEII